MIEFELGLGKLEILIEEEIILIDAEALHAKAENVVCAYFLKINP